jgi:hypothetical protein
LAGLAIGLARGRRGGAVARTEAESAATEAPKLEALFVGAAARSGRDEGCDKGDEHEEGGDEAHLGQASKGVAACTCNRKESKGEKTAR